MLSSPRIAAFFCILFASFVRGENSPESILLNGNLEGGVAGWAPSQGASVQEEDGNSFIHLQADAPGEQVQMYQKVSLPGGSQSVSVSFRVRYSDLKPGAENWHTGRVVMHFKDASGQILKPDPQPFAFKGNSDGWVEKSRHITVPEGATSFEFMPALFQVASGTLDIDDISVIPSDTPAADP